MKFHRFSLLWKLLFQQIQTWKLCASVHFTPFREIPSMICKYFPKWCGMDDVYLIRNSQRLLVTMSKTLLVWLNYFWFFFGKFRYWLATYSICLRCFFHLSDINSCTKCYNFGSKVETKLGQFADAVNARITLSCHYFDRMINCLYNSS